MAGEQELLGATQAAVEAYMEKQRRTGSKRVLGIDVGKLGYVGFRMPGLSRPDMFSDPYAMLTRGAQMKAEGRQLTWRKPDDSVTKSMCLRGVLRPITTSEVDPKSPIAKIDRVKVLTRDGPREVVRTPKGLGLFEIAPLKDLSDGDLGDVPGDHWDRKYLSDLVDQADQFSTEVEQLSQSSAQGRATGSWESRDTTVEVI